jgi:hypothetical protein
MIVTVSNFRGCARAQLECAPIALLAGANAAGKSSVAQAVAAALSGNALPVAGVRSNAAGALVRSGAATGTVEISSDDGTCYLDWPEMRRRVTGKPPEASEYATGLQTVATMAPKDRLRVLAEYLHADPTREDLATALAEAGLDGTRALETLWPTIEQQGWDGAVALRRERGAQLKGMWRQVTGANYGSRVAASWRPDLAELNKEELEHELRDAKTARDRALTAEAVSAAERRRVEELAELCDARHDALARAKARVEEYAAAYRQAQEARAAVPPAERDSTVPCPYCGEPIVINKASLVEMRLERATGAAVDDVELRKRRMAIAEADGKLSRAAGDLTQARKEVAMAETAVQDSVEARDRLAAWPRAVEAEIGREAAEARLVDAEKRLVEFTTKEEADRLHALIEGNEIVIELLAADGLRAKKLARVLDVFNATLADLADSANWPAVRLDAAGHITLGDMPYGLLSSSEQYRVRAVLAVAMAQIDGSQLVIFDGADILDAPSRSGLFALLETVNLPALVCMTLPRNRVPDLAASEAGASYWLAGGVVEPLGARIAA